MENNKITLEEFWKSEEHLSIVILKKNQINY